MPSLRFNFPYKAAGRRAPDRPPVLEAAVRDADGRAGPTHEAPARSARARRALHGRPDLLDGRGRRSRLRTTRRSCCSATRCTRPADPTQLRVDHFPQLRVPSLFVSGTRDAVRHARGTETPDQEAEGPGLVPLDRDRRSRIQAAESRVDCTVAGVLADVAGAGRRIRYAASGVKVTDSSPCESTAGSRSSTSPDSRRSVTSSATTSRYACSRCSVPRCVRWRPTSACASPSGSATAACWCRSIPAQLIGAVTKLELLTHELELPLSMHAGCAGGA